MRVAGIGLLMAVLAAGCAVQPGSEGDADWTPPNEVTARPGAGAPTASVMPESAQGAGTPDNGADSQGPGNASPQQHPDPAPWITPGAGGPSDSTPGGQQGGTNGHPDPAPWHPTTTITGTSTNTGGSSASAPGDSDPLDGHPRLPLAFQR